MSEAIWIENNISLVPSFLMLHTEKHWKNWDWPGDEAKIMCDKHMSINRDKLDLFKTQFCHYEYMIAWKYNMHCWKFFFFFLLQMLSYISMWTAKRSKAVEEDIPSASAKGNPLLIYKLH